MGLIKTAATVAVASSVHGRVKRRQQEKWADQAGASPAVDRNAVMLSQLTQLGDLKAAGVLTEAEFEAKKAQILGL